MLLNNIERYHGTLLEIGASLSPEALEGLKNVLQHNHLLYYLRKYNVDNYPIVHEYTRKHVILEEEERGLKDVRIDR